MSLVVDCSCGGSVGGFSHSLSYVGEDLARDHWVWSPWLREPTWTEEKTALSEEVVADEEPGFLLVLVWCSYIPDQ